MICSSWCRSKDKKAAHRDRVRCIRRFPASGRRGLASHQMYGSTHRWRTRRWRGSAPSSMATNLPAMTTTAVADWRLMMVRRMECRWWERRPRRGTLKGSNNDDDDGRDADYGQQGTHVTVYTIYPSICMDLKPAAAAILNAQYTVETVENNTASKPADRTGSLYVHWDYCSSGHWSYSKFSKYSQPNRWFRWKLHIYIYTWGPRGPYQISSSTKL